VSLPRRLWRLARHSVRSLPNFTLDGHPTNRTLSDAERELEEYLETAAAPPSPPPPHPMVEQYATLGLTVGADVATVERTWRRLVLKNHPDRFAGDPVAEKTASERLRRINAAHEEVVRWLRDHESG
jgi:DnaJ-class molecular chaperone